MENNIYSVLADSYEKLAAGFRALANQDAAPGPSEDKPAVPKNQYLP